MSTTIHKPDLNKNQKAIQLITTLLSKYSIVPELFEVIDDPIITFKLLQAFAGLTIKFPSLESIKSIIIATDIVLRIEMNQDKELEEVVKSLCDDYFIKPKDVANIYEKVKQKIINSSEEEIDQLTNLIYESINKKKDISTNEKIIRRRIKSLRVQESRE